MHILLCVRSLRKLHPNMFQTDTFVFQIDIEIRVFWRPLHIINFEVRQRVLNPTLINASQLLTPYVLGVYGLTE